MELERWRQWSSLAVCGAALAGLAGCGGGGGGTTLSAAGATGETSATSAASADAAAAAPDAAATAPSVASPSSTPGMVESAPVNSAATTPAPAATVRPAAPISPPATVAPVSASGGAPTLGDCEMFPSNAIFNTRIDDTARFPVHPKTAEWQALVGRDVPFSTDWGVDVDPNNHSNYFGMPINVIDSGSTDWPVVSFDFATSGVFWDKGYPDKSDCAVPDGHGGYTIGRSCGSTPSSQRHFPFPVASKIVNEDGTCNDPHSCGDRHVLVVEKGACRLWESFFSYNLSGQWYTMATAAWDLKSLALRPDDWASGDAAGLPITPLLAKAAEAGSGEIRHALRVNFSDAKLALEHVWPARFAAGGDNPGAIPFGALMRLRADFPIPDDWTPQAKALATAAKRYGLYVSDNGADFFVQGEPNAAWDIRANAQMRSITMKDMEFVDLKSITGDSRFSPNSMAASW